MIFHPTPLPGAYIVETEPRTDERGFFARQFCSKEFQEFGLVGDFLQVNTSSNPTKGTLRGMHYQLGSAAETKLIRCIRGAIWDCIIDLRPNSETRGQWYGTRLSDENRLALYVPKGFAHGFLSLTPDSELLYFVDALYNPERERGVRWNDPYFAIEWPGSPSLISAKDRSHPDFDPDYHLGLPEPS